MFITYVAVTILTVAFNVFSATCDYIRYKPVLIAMEKAGVSEKWLYTFGILKTAGVLGLLAGFYIPQIGIAAAIGLILFFVAAIITHLRAHDNSFGLAAVFLLLAIASLVLRLLS